MEYTRPIGSIFNEYKRCSKGHVYDPSISPTCPICAEEEEAVGTRPVEEPFMRKYSPTKPVEEKTPNTVPVEDSSEKTRSMVDEIDVTLPMGYEDGKEYKIENTKNFFNPLVGWLVCVDGPAKGTDYRIYSGYNYIGRDPSMNICIMGDPYISRERDAVVAFDGRTSKFYFSPSNGQSIIRMNDEIVLMPVEIKIHDILELGHTKLMFIPLCDGAFHWE